MASFWFCRYRLAHDGVRAREAHYCAPKSRIPIFSPKLCNAKKAKILNFHQNLPHAKMSPFCRIGKLLRALESPGCLLSSLVGPGMRMMECAREAHYRMPKSRIFTFLPKICFWLCPVCVCVCVCANHAGVTDVRKT